MLWSHMKAYCVTIYSFNLRVLVWLTYFILILIPFFRFSSPLPRRTQLKKKKSDKYLSKARILDDLYFWHNFVHLKMVIFSQYFFLKTTRLSHWFLYSFFKWELKNFFFFIWLTIFLSMCLFFPALFQIAPIYACFPFCFLWYDSHK